MKQSEQKQEPLMVLNPYNGKYVNLQPLFEFGEFYNNELQDIAESCDKAIRHLCMYVEESPGNEHKDVLFTLFELRDVFSCMKAIEIKERAR